MFKSKRNNIDIQRLKEDAENGDTEAMFKYGIMLLKGENVRRNYIKARELIKAAADNGNPDAMIAYADLLSKPPTLTRKEIICYNLKRASDDGDIKATFYYGTLLSQDDGDPYDTEEGIKYIKLAADKGNVNAIFDYAKRLKDGKDVVVNKEEAAKYFKIAADNGCVEAMRIYSVMLKEGDGIEVNLIQAQKYLKMAHSDNNEDYNSNENAKSQKNGTTSEKTNLKSSRSGKHGIPESESEDSDSEEMQKRSKRGKRVISKNESEDSDSEEEEQKRSKRGKRVISDSESEDSDSEEIQKRSKRGRCRISDSDSEEMRTKKSKSGKHRIPDSELESSDSEEIQKRSKRGKHGIAENESESSDSEEIQKRSKRGRCRISDSDSEEMRTKKSKSGKHRIPDSESEKSYSEDNCIIDLNEEKNFDVIQKIGEGTTSTIFKLKNRTTLKPICKKVLNIEGTTFDDLRNAIKEFQILHYLKHPCICRAIGINTCDVVKEKTQKENEITTISLYLEYVDFTLKAILPNEIINNTLKSRIVVEIAHGMRYIHNKNMIYRDLNIDSIMLNAVFNVKLIDFGLARINEHLFGEEMMYSLSLTKGVGLDDFMSPEMMMQKDYDNKTDFIHSVLSCIIYSLVKFLNKKSTIKQKKENSITERIKINI